MPPIVYVSLSCGRGFAKDVPRLVDNCCSANQIEVLLGGVAEVVLGAKRESIQCVRVQEIDSEQMIRDSCL